VLATVNGIVIAAGGLCDELSVTSGLGPLIGARALHELGRPLLEQLVDGALIDAALAARGRSIEPAEVRRELERAGSAAAAAAGAERTALERQVRARIARKRLVDFHGRLVVTEAEVEAAYSANPEKWAIERGPATVQGFVYRLSPGAPADEIEAGRAIAESFAETLRAGSPKAPPSLGRDMRSLRIFTVKAGGLEPELEAAVQGLA
jgi:hypothetical protein